MKAGGVLGRAANGISKGAKVLDGANAVADVGRGVADMVQNGVSVGNVAQAALGVLGLKGIAGGLSGGKINAGLSGLIHGKLGTSILHKPLAVVGNFLGFKVCFAAGTPIRTPDGWKAIDELAVGDLVLSRDEHNCEGAVEAKPVEEVFVREGLLWELRVGGQVIKTTAEHPFFVLNKGWTAANLLQVGDGILTEVGHWQAVEGIRDTGEWTTVYNVCIADWHTYFVGRAEWGWSLWAHNTTTCIGRMKDLERFADDSQVDTWAKSGRIPKEGEPPVTWPENESWLYDRILRGDDFALATDPTTLPKVLGGYIPGKPNGYFTAKELEFLRKYGIEILPWY